MYLEYSHYVIMSGNRVADVALQWAADKGVFREVSEFKPPDECIPVYKNLKMHKNTPHSQWKAPKSNPPEICWAANISTVGGRLNLCPQTTELNGRGGQI